MADKDDARSRRAAALRERSQRRGGDFDSIFAANLPTFSPKEGSYILRILPPTWKNADHYGFDIHVHYGIGADEASYICPKKMNRGKCPICEERDRLMKAGDKDEAKKFRATPRSVVWVIDRDAEKDGPKLWGMPFTLDKSLAELSQNKRTGAVLFIDDTEEGYDVMFSRDGTGVQTRYTGLQIDREASALSNRSKQMAEWLEFIDEHPIPDCLVVRDYDYLRDVFMGGMEDDDKGRDRDDDRSSRRSRDDDEAPRSRRGRDDEDEAPRSRRARDDDDEPRSRLRDRYAGEDREEDPPSRTSRGARDTEDDNPLPDETEERAPPSRGRREPEPEPERRSTRRVREEPEDEEAPSPPKRGRVRDEPEDEDPSDEEEDKGRASSPRSNSLAERLAAAGRKK